MSAVPNEAPDRWDVPPMLVPSSSVVPVTVTPPAAIARVQVGPSAPVAEGEVCWVGTHGGCGVSSIAHTAGSTLELQREWPDPTRGWPTRVVLVARSNAAGLDAAGVFLQELARGRVADLELVALAVNADAPGRVPAPVRDRIAEISAVAHVVRLPWVKAWRAQPQWVDTSMKTAVANVATENRKGKS